MNLKTLDGNCSCPYSTNCKHAVAAYLVYEKGKYINSDSFIEYLNSLSKRKLIDMIVENLNNNPKIALKYDLKKSTNFESFVDDFIDDFSYSKMNKAEILLENFSFDQLLRMIEFLDKNEDDVFEKIYEEYDVPDEGDILYDFKYKLNEELVKKILTEEQLRQVLKRNLAIDEIADEAERFVKFKDIIKDQFSKDDYLNFLLRLKNPNLSEIKENVTKSNIFFLYALPEYNIGLSEKLSNFLDDKKLLFLVALHKEDYQSVIKYSEVLSRIDRSIESNILKLIDLLIKNKLKDGDIAKKILKDKYIEILKKYQIEYLVNIINDYSHLKEQLNFNDQFYQDRFYKNIIILKRMFMLDKEKTRMVIGSQKNLLKKRNWNDIIEILKFLRNGYGEEYTINLIKENEDVFKTSSTLKFNLKKEGIFVNYSNGIFCVEVKNAIG